MRYYFTLKVHISYGKFYFKKRNKLSQCLSGTIFYFQEMTISYNSVAASGVSSLLMGKK